RRRRPPNGSRVRSSTPSICSAHSSSPTTASPPRRRADSASLRAPSDASARVRLGFDLPAFGGGLAAELAKRARVQGGSLSLDPRAKASIERAEAEARRLGDEYVSTEHLLLGVSEAGGEAQALLERHAAGKEAILQALQSVRGGQ